MRGLTLLDHLWQDARYAAGQLRAHLVHVTATLILALGMCASVSIFAFVDATLVKPLPYDSRRGSWASTSVSRCFHEQPLVTPSTSTGNGRTPSSPRSTSTTADVPAAKTVRERARAGARVSDGFFRTLGVRPIVGRDFRAGEDLPSGPPLVIRTYSAWQNRYGGRPRPSAARYPERLPYVIIGVLPRDFHFAPAEPADFWAALHPETECDLRRSCHSLYGIGRLKEGVSIESRHGQRGGHRRRPREGLSGLEPRAGCIARAPPRK